MQQQFVNCCELDTRLPGHYNVAPWRRWLTKICPPGIKVLPVLHQNWLNAAFIEEGIRITGSKTDFLFVIETEQTCRLPQNPTPEQLRQLPGNSIVGAYEAKTSSFILKKGTLGLAPQVAVQALALNWMSRTRRGKYFIPVFGGDFNDHVVLHAAPTADGFELHAATSSDGDDPQLAPRYMQYLLLRTKACAEAASQGEGLHTAVTRLQHHVIRVLVSLCLATYSLYQISAEQPNLQHNVRQ